MFKIKEQYYLEIIDDYFLKNINFWKLDIEDSFLEGTWDETVFVKIPHGIEYVDSKLKRL